MKRYEKLADDIAELIRTGVIAPVRALAAAHTSLPDSCKKTTSIQLLPHP